MVSVSTLFSLTELGICVETFPCDQTYFTSVEMLDSIWGHFSNDIHRASQSFTGMDLFNFIFPWHKPINLRCHLKCNNCGPEGSTCERRSVHSWHSWTGRICPPWTAVSCTVYMCHLTVTRQRAQSPAGKHPTHNRKLTILTTDYTSSVKMNSKVA